MSEDGDADYPVITGRLRRSGRAVGVASRSSRARRWTPPTPIFRKLDPSVVEEELARLETKADA